MRPRKNTKAGSSAGSVKPNGYLRIVFDGRGYLGHRLVWFFVHGVWPDKQIDHINGERSDNRIANLRLATCTQNLGNARKPSHNTSGLKGVSWNKATKKWLTQIQVYGKATCLGFFADASEAHEAYRSAAIARFGEFARAE